MNFKFLIKKSILTLRVDPLLSKNFISPRKYGSLLNGIAKAHGCCELIDLSKLKIIVSNNKTIKPTKFFELLSQTHHDL